MGQTSSSSKTKRPRRTPQQRLENEQAAVEKPLSQEEVATVCRQCKTLKRAPRGKKISWRRGCNNWMIVDARAADEATPEEEGEEEEEDEEEPAPDDAYESQEHGEPDDASRFPPKKGESHRSDTDMEDDTVRYASDQPPHTPGFDDTRLRSSTEEPERGPEQQNEPLQSDQPPYHGAQRETSTETLTPKAPGEKHANGTEGPHTPSRHPSPTRSPSVTLTHSASFQPPLQSHTTSRKRPASDVSQEMPASKKLRIDIDFTTESDDAPVIKKEEEEEEEDFKIRQPSSFRAWRTGTKTSCANSWRTWSCRKMSCSCNRTDSN